ncbi:MAG: iron-containing alcohol dehydrogenase [Clostridia bacterium]|nr:iron-containing alcohol dehydrogenase [Clostridia bacterium]
MLDFTYYTPTKVIFGKDSHKKVGKIIKDYGYKKIMMQYGKGSIIKSGLYDEVMRSLKENDIEVVEMGGVEPNPKLSFVRKAIDVARKENVEMILAVGGGSAIDSSKYTASGAKYDGDVWDFPSRIATPEDALPVGCILTNSAAGSEMSSSAVISNEELNIKRGYNSEFNRCKFAICNPELTYTVSKYQTSCGIVDIMSHTMERYFSVCPPTDLTDRICEGLLKSVIKSAKVLIDNPNDYDARATIMWASSLSHNDLTGSGRQHVLPVHQFEHALSGEYHEIAHGAGLAVLLPAWARYVYKHNPERFSQFARRVWDIEDNDDMSASVKGIEAMESFFKSIDMLLKLREFNIPQSCTERLADLCTYGKQRTIPTYIELEYDDVKNIFDLCY